jgi:hypothetical protein
MMMTKDCCARMKIFRLERFKPDVDCVFHFSFIYNINVCKSRVSSLV